MRRFLPFLTAAALVATALHGASTGAAASPVARSRVIVSTTLNSTIELFDTATLEQTQPPVPSRGGGPVRMVVANDGSGLHLYTANHGVAEGSVGSFDLSGATVLEDPLSPFPARAGSVGIDAAEVMLPDFTVARVVYVTNTHFALGGCGLPNGSVTAFERTSVGASVVRTPRLREVGTIDISGPIPYGVGVDPKSGRAFVSSNCGSTLDTVDLIRDAPPSTLSSGLRIAKSATRATGAGPDAVMFDARTNLVYVADITGSSLSVFDATSPGARTTVPLPGAHPIDLALADSPGGHHWVITSNGGNDSISLLDRDVIAACALAVVADCPEAEVLRVPTAVKGGAPEGVAYDAVTNRVFVVNKSIFAPTLSVVQITETPISVSGEDIARIPLQAAGAGTPIPAFIAFDVVVAPYPLPVA